MARKKTSTSRKKKTAPKGKSNRRSTPRKPASKKRASKSKSTKTKSRKMSMFGAGFFESFSPQSISFDRWMDIVGVGVGLVGLLTLISLLFPGSGGLVSGWIETLDNIFGWGMFLFPIGLIICGGWLVLRKLERVPRFGFERILGVTILFLVLLAALHFTIQLLNELPVQAVREISDAGGDVGGILADSLSRAFGSGGTAIMLLAFLVIGLALSLDKTIAEMVSSVSPLFQQFQNWVEDTWDTFIARKEKKRNKTEPQSDSIPAFGGSGPSGKGIETDSGLAEKPVNVDGLSYDLQDAPLTWKLPALDEILEHGGKAEFDEEVDLQRAHVIEETLSSFGAPGRVIEINRGPTITQFGVEPDFIETRSGRTRVRVGKINGLADDLALALAARRIRIQAPVPGKGYVGIEVPNEEVALVTLRDILESQAFKRLKSPLAFTLGQNVSGNAVAADLAAMPHLLIAGSTGSGKSVCVNALISCLLMNNTPNDLRLIMVDPKRVELTGYNGIPHLLAPVVVELERVVRVLQWVAREMDMRYRKLAEAGCRSVQDYNQIQESEDGQKLPYLVVIIDELADLMMIAPDETERMITRLAQLARATGIHLVISTQRPSVDVVTGLIKANFPARIAFAVASGVDSRVILDQPGAERLLGRGDMLFQAPDAPAPVRLQGVYLSDPEIQRLVNYWRGFAGVAGAGQTTAGGVVDGPAPILPMKQMPIWEEMEEEENMDPLFDEAIDLCRRQGRASISMLQRRLRIGYTRAARLIETMEEKGIVSAPTPGSGTREILDYGQAAPPVDEE